LRPWSDAQDVARSEPLQHLWSNSSTEERPGRIARRRRTGKNACSTVRGSNLQHIALLQSPSLVAPKPAQEMRRRAAQKILHDNSALYAQIAPCSRTRRTNLQCLSRLHFHRGPRLNRPSIQRRAEIGTCQRQHGAIRKSKSPPKQRHLQSSRVFRVSHYPIPDP